jgi:hypothetical protein
MTYEEQTLKELRRDTIIGLAVQPLGLALIIWGLLTGWEGGPLLSSIGGGVVGLALAAVLLARSHRKELKRWS